MSTTQKRTCSLEPGYKLWGIRPETGLGNEAHFSDWPGCPHFQTVYIYILIYLLHLVRLFQTISTERLVEGWFFFSPWNETFGIFS